MPGRKRGLPSVPKSEVIKRNQAASALLAGGASREEIDHQLAIEFSMTSRAVGVLLTRVVKNWSDEEVERRPHMKRAAVKRMHSHIASARAAKNYGAVSSLERLLAQMQGTLEPIEINVNIDATVRESVINVVAMATPARLEQLATAALRMRTAARLPLPAEAPVVVDEPRD